jgi:hypothetical protein
VRFATRVRRLGSDAAFGFSSSGDQSTPATSAKQIGTDRGRPSVAEIVVSVARRASVSSATSSGESIRRG